MELLPRHMEFHNTETVLLLLCLLLIAAARGLHTGKFRYFLFIFFSDKYLKIYGKGQSLYYNWFHLFLFIVQLISFSLFLSIAVAYFQLNMVINPFIILLFIAVFILTKFLIEKLISFLLNLERLANRYNFHKLSYRNFLGITLLPFNALLLYNPNYRSAIIYTTLTLFGLLYITAFILTLKSNQKAISRHPFYFILYLCTLEIAPYLIMARALIVT